MRLALSALLLMSACAGPAPTRPFETRIDWPAGTKFTITREIAWKATPGAFHPAHDVTTPVEWDSRAVIEGRVVKVEGRMRLVEVRIRSARVRSLEDGRRRDFTYARDTGLVNVETGEVLGDHPQWSAPRTAIMSEDGGVHAWLVPAGILGTLLGENGITLLTGFIFPPPDGRIAEGVRWNEDRFLQIGRYDSVDLESAIHAAGGDGTTHRVEVDIALSSSASPHLGMAGKRIGQGTWTVAEDMTAIDGLARFTLEDEEGRVILQFRDSVRFTRP